MDLLSEHINLRIKGVVIPVDWDRRGNIVQVAIRSDNFETYIVDIDGNAELLPNIDQVVEVDATIVGEDVMGQKIVRLHAK